MRNDGDEYSQGEYGEEVFYGDLMEDDSRCDGQIYCFSVKILKM